MRPVRHLYTQNELEISKELGEGCDTNGMQKGFLIEI